MATRWSLIIVVAFSTVASAADDKEAIRESAVALLRQALSRETRGVKIHAA